MVTPTTPLMRLLKQQHGLVTVDQAGQLGISRSALCRRASAGQMPCQRVLPRVYGMFTGDPSALQRASAAALYVGSEAQVTGTAALQLYGIRRLTETQTVQVLVPEKRCVQSTKFVVVIRVVAPSRLHVRKAIPVAPVARAVVDAAGLCTTYDDVLALASAAIMSRRTTLAAIEDEVAKASWRTTVLIRRVLVEARTGSRSVPEAELRALFVAAGLPEPLINVPLEIDGEVFVPDVRWGMFIVEVDSKEWHLLEPGSWERTQARRTRLEAAGYHVLPITPQQIRATPTEVLAAVRMRYALSLRQGR
ncbi:hypothetical protein acdb102_35130 [Acidothermaceae bacterium B102]|nr:hypothetical protein acdb102_35130 [Acidothermaceae bacterium B102]